MTQKQRTFTIKKPGCSPSKSMMEEELHNITFAIPISEPLPSQYIVRVINDIWLGSEASVPISFKTMILHGAMPSHTELLDLDPLSVGLLKEKDLPVPIQVFLH